MTKICIIASSTHEAYNYARNQNLELNQWFHPNDINDLLLRSNFHVIVVGMPGLNMQNFQFEKLYKVALERGRIGRT